MTTEQKYKAIKKRLGLSDTDVARMFGYKDANTFRNSSGKDNVVNGIVGLYEQIEGLFKLSSPDQDLPL